MLELSLTSKFRWRSNELKLNVKGNIDVKAKFQGKASNQLKVQVQFELESNGWSVVDVDAHFDLQPELALDLEFDMGGTLDVATDKGITTTWLQLRSRFSS